MKLFRKGSSSTTSTSSTSKDSSQNHFDKLENRNDDDSVTIDCISREGERMDSTETDAKRRRRKGGKSNRNRRRRKEALNPKRLLCFRKMSFDAEDNQDGMRENAFNSPKSHKYVVEYDYQHTGLSQDERQGGSTDEFCDNYFSRDQKREERAIILTAENAQVLAALSRDERSSAPMYAPLREFKGGKKGKERMYQDHEREFQKERDHIYNENLKQFQRRQHSLVDDLSSTRSSIQSESDQKKTSTTNRNGKKRGDNSAVSMISSITSSSYSTAEIDPSTVGLSAATSTDSSVILSPYAHNPPRRKNLRSRSNRKKKMFSQRVRSSAHSNLGTIAESYNEFDDTSSSSSSFFSSSSYYSDSSSLDSDSESDSESYNESDSDGSESDRDSESDSDSENEELSVIYAHARVASLIKNQRYDEEDISTVGPANQGCAAGPVDGYWKKLLFNGKNNEPGKDGSPVDDVRMSINQVYVS